MELKYIDKKTGLYLTFCSNRTFMELKLSIALEIEVTTKSVLIVPLWN